MKKAAVYGVPAMVCAMVMGAVSLPSMFEATSSNFVMAIKYLKAAGIFSFVIAIVFLAMRAGLVKVVMVPDNASLVQARRSKLVRNHDGSIRMYDSGRNRFHIHIYRHMVLVHHGVRYTQLGDHDFVIDGANHTARFTLKWRIPNDPLAIKQAVTEVCDLNWWDGKFNQLHEAAAEIATMGLAASIANADDLTKPFLPTPRVVDQFKRYGIDAVVYMASPVTRTDAQIAQDGNRMIADAIARASCTQANE